MIRKNFIQRAVILSLLFALLLNISAVTTGAVLTFPVASADQEGEPGEVESAPEEEESVEIAEDGEDGDSAQNGEVNDESETIIETGDAEASSDVVNEVNTNTTNATGSIEIVTNMGPSSTTVDFRPATSSEESATSSNNFENFDEVDIGTESTTNNDNVATTTTGVTLSADSGANQIIEAAGEAKIITGDALVSSNIVNLINTNITNSEYLILILNNFGDFDGDVILPGVEFFAFLSQLSQQFSASQEQIVEVIENENLAEVINNVELEATSGDNQATSTSGSTTINSGEAEIISNTHNLVNQNISNDDAVYILIRVSKEWNGQIYSLPEGLSWMQTPEGIVLFSQSSDSESPALQFLGEDSSLNSTTTVSNVNGAYVENNVDLLANSGLNMVTAEGDVLIDTGKVQAISNIINIVNTNIFGRNWLLGFISIFGNWNGNLAFGQPDLWIAQQASLSDEELEEGSTIEMQLTVKNNGDADATNLVIDAFYDLSDIISFDLPSGAELVGDKLRWTIPRLNRGQSTILNYSASLSSAVPEGADEIRAMAEVSAFEPDAQDFDNSDELIFGLAFLAQESSSSSGGGSQRSSRPGSRSSNDSEVSLTLEKRIEGSSILDPGQSAFYILKLVNEGPDKAARVIIEDTVYGPDGSIIATNSFPFDDVLSGETILVDYELAFSETAPAGSYRSEAFAAAYNENGELIALTSAEHFLTMRASLSPPEGLVLGAFSAFSSLPLFIQAAQLSLADEEEILGESKVKNIALNRPTSTDLIALSENDPFATRALANMVILWTVLSAGVISFMRFFG
ncbi:MAG: hypothetical protein Q8P45_00045 [Candidatus Harrisonbacteria bacterium]|nr:hypothetical protein [Candidatus Harrisonbacteria bacterium]